MSSKTLFASALSIAGICVLAGCATQPAAEAPVPAAPATAAVAALPPVAPADEARPEADAASQLEKKFRDAAKSYRVVQKDGKTLYCKKEKVIGRNIPTVQCITESQLRLQVEQMDDLRERMRGSAKCTLGRSGAGGACGGG